MVRIGNRTGRFIIGLSAGVVVIAGVACAGNDPATPAAGDDISGAPAASQGPGPGGSTSMMVQRPQSVGQLVERSEVIFVGKVESATERMLEPYGDEGKTDIRSPYTDYAVRVEEVLKSDGKIGASSVVTVRMYGHEGDEKEYASLIQFALPDVGDHLILALATNPDGTYGSGPEGLIEAEGAKAEYIDGEDFAESISPAELKSRVKAAL
ncbi:MAG: hypothetical protein FJ319_03560 [SAR202 cluster bacterium]|nr:hypothetical protein [SAR202 cluster bacterium]